MQLLPKEDNKRQEMSDNSELRPIHQAKPISSTYCDPVLIKDGTVSCLYRVSRAGKYFIIKTAKGESGVYADMIRREYEQTFFKKSQKNIWRTHEMAIPLQSQMRMWRNW